MKTQPALSALLLAQALRLGTVSAAKQKKESSVTKAQGPPPFFLQDPTDSLCLGGDEFKRCSIDTLFFVVGAPGKYQIHKRPLEESSDMGADEGICITKPSCSEKDSNKIQEVKLAKCTHCGAKNWNILGDSETGYVLTEGEEDTKVCVVREKDSKKVKVAPCDSDEVNYTPLQLQFASTADITAMSSAGARFIGAASDGDKKQVQSFLKSKEVDVNERDWDDLTALITAASAGHLEIVKILLKAGADVDSSDKDGITALMEASIMGHEKIVNVLIDAGAEVDFKSNSGVTALWLAAGENKVNVLKTLLKKNADASVTRSDGITALMTGSVAGHVEAVKLLIEDGADPLAVDADGLTALMNAAEKGATNVMKVLIAAADSADYVNTMSSTGFNSVIIASAHGHTDSVKYLITEANADVNLVHDNQVSALMYAAASGHVETMKTLLEDGKVGINMVHTNGGSALVEACTAGASDAITFLIKNGADYNIIDNDGVTPLMAIAAQGDISGVNTVINALKKDKDDAMLKEHINLFSFSGGSAVMFAAAGGHANATKALIDLGADVNAVAQATPAYLEKLAVMIEEGTVDDNDPHVDGVTAVHVAAQGGHLECANILIEAGADVTIQDDEDRTPLLLAVKGNYGDVAIALVKGGADPNTPYIDDEGASHNLLFDSLVVENEEFATLLIESGADIYSEDEHKVATLLQASHRGMKDVVKALIGKNTKAGWVDSPSDESITPLIAASSEGHLEIANMLIDANANVNAKDKDETNSLMAAAAKGHTDIVETLLKAGANVNEQNVDGHTALMFAYNGKNQVETLWERYHQFVKESEIESKGEAVDDGGTGPIIREALDNHNRMVTLLIKNGADESIKDKEGHKALDFDYHPDTDAEVLKQEEQAGKKRDASKNEL